MAGQLARRLDQAPGAPNRPIRSSISWRAMAPGRSSRAGRRQSHHGGSMPNVALPASRMKSSLPPRLSATCGAMVAVT